MIKKKILRNNGGKENNKKNKWSTVKWKDNIKQKKLSLFAEYGNLSQWEWCIQQGLMWSVS